MTDYQTPGGTQLPDPEEQPEPRTPPLDDPDDEGPGGVPDVPEEPDESNVELPDEAEHRRERPHPGRGTPNEDLRGREDRKTERGNTSD